MPKFIIRNQDGTIKYDLSRSMPKRLGQVLMNKDGGSVTVSAAPADGVPWFYVYGSVGGFMISFSGAALNGNVISWGPIKHLNGQYVAGDFHLIYGIF